jgi:hypothetical protein
MSKVSENPRGDAPAPSEDHSRAGQCFGAFPEPYSRLLNASDATRARAALAAVWSELEAHRERALDTLTKLDQRSGETLRDLIALTVLASAADLEASGTLAASHNTLNVDAQRTLAALEVPATAVHRHTGYSAVFFSFVVGSVIAFNRMGWSALVYVLAAVVLLCALYWFQASRDYETFMRARLLDVLLRYRSSVQELAGFLEARAGELPNLAQHRHDMERDGAMIFAGVVATWRRARDANENTASAADEAEGPA